MHKFYADDTSLIKVKGDKTPSIYMFGGILISREEELKLARLMRLVKSQYTGEDMPIKYNMKALHGTYAQFGKTAELTNLIKESKEWRKRMLEDSLQIEYKVFISIVENLSKSTQLRIVKPGISAIMFSNALMRVGIYAKGMKLDYTQVILDWPEAGNPKPFDQEYYYGYHRGTSRASQTTEYYSGSLRQLGFDETLYYARCNHSNMLQFADIVVGSLRDFIETRIQGLRDSIGEDLSKTIVSKYYGYPNLLGYGINLQSRDTDMKNTIAPLIELLTPDKITKFQDSL